jgi:endonuclease/exonuclease/phosphatase family metal-dependent hydrolase
MKNNWKFRLDEIIKRTRALSPELIAFQEVCQGNGEDQIKYLKRKLLHKSGYKHLEAKFTHLSWGKYREYIVLISKKDPDYVLKGNLPDSPLRRSYIAFLLGETWYVNTHLEYHSRNQKFRKKQIEYLVDKFKYTPHVIMGDFNSSPDAQEQSPFAQNKYNSFFPGRTHIGDDGNREAWIDGFWISKERMDNLKKSKAKIIFDKRVNGQYLSDHFAVYLSKE